MGRKELDEHLLFILLIAGRDGPSRPTKCRRPGDHGPPAGAAGHNINRPSSTVLGRLKLACIGNKYLLFLYLMCFLTLVMIYALVRLRETRASKLNQSI